MQGEISNLIFLIVLFPFLYYFKKTFVWNKVEHVFFPDRHYSEIHYFLARKILLLGKSKIGVTAISVKAQDKVVWGGGDDIENFSCPTSIRIFHSHPIENQNMSGFFQNSGV